VQRQITAQLLAWSDSPRRKPLIVRGARQVGKTWAVNDLGRRRFDTVHVVDLERRRDWHRVFSGDLDAPGIVAQLETLLGHRFVPGRDLLFLDEIQACPAALSALRYFYEQLPDLHVIAAGSLLEFAMGGLSFPVGRVQFLNVYPFSLVEFLWALNEDVGAQVISDRPVAVSVAVHDHLLDLVRRFFFVGGMPEAVAAYAATTSLQEAFAVQDELVTAYCEDFGKYGGRTDKAALDAVLTGAARGVGDQVKYARLAEGFHGATIKRSFDLLAQARVLRPVRAASPAGAPLTVRASQRRFKAIMVDVGVMQRLCGLRADVEYARSDLLSVFRGALAEQFVGQELLAATGADLFYWVREARGSSAEVDYLVDDGRRIVPVEVKSGSAGRLRSLHLLMDAYPGAAPGVVISGRPYAELPEQRLVFAPLYFAASLARGGFSPGTSDESGA
jgi:predicted AAA+ superfamily ATPase